MRPHAMTKLELVQHRCIFTVVGRSRFHIHERCHGCGARRKAARLTPTPAHQSGSEA